MKAIRVHAAGGPEALGTKTCRGPEPRQGEALVKIAAAGLNYIDVYFRTGAYKGSFPFTLGVEGAGTVRGAGAGVTEVRVGDRVASVSMAGSYAEYATAPAEKLVTLPDGIRFPQAAAAMLQGMTAHYLARSTYPLKPGDTCLVQAAAGGAGQLLCQVAKISGATVIGTAGGPEKDAHRARGGADEVIDYQSQDFRGRGPATRPAARESRWFTTRSARRRSRRD
jgi:NADPH2:quinone reductase